VSVVDEVKKLSDQGFREVTLLGQNVNSYRDGDVDFADLLALVAAVDHGMRIRFTTSHPQDMSDKLIETVASHQNICKYIHLPIQSGSDRILNLMNRTYTVAEYLGLVERIRTRIPSASLSTDIICGFPTETLDEHRMTMDVMRTVRYDGAFTFKYSPREGTAAWEMRDDISEEEKGRRVFEISELQQEISKKLNERLIGTVQEVLVEGPSRKRDGFLVGRTDGNRTVVFPGSNERASDMINVLISRVNSATAFGTRV
jgi:tRNA-2-methylthio-N6-dimethylallyladenosine synthase